MIVERLDHVNIRVKDMEATAAFFTEVLGMRRSTERASWILDAAGHPAIHLGDANMPYPSDDWRPFHAVQGGGAVHHVALSCTGHDTMIARLEARGLTYSTNEIAGQLRQIFVAEPDDILLELNFWGD